jgi:hypothetical protein
MPETFVSNAKRQMPDAGDKNLIWGPNSKPAILAGLNNSGRLQ